MPKHTRPTAITALSLPPIDVKRMVSADGSKIYDPLRDKWVALTPEEWVRQHFTSWLVTCHGYRAAFMANEVSLRLNGMLRRCDTLVYNRHLEPRVVVEYKAPDIVITRKVFDQIARYNLVLQARWLVVSNGLTHYCCRYEQCDDGNSYTFQPSLPTFQDIYEL